ncbi:MAG: choloylglycine hydrolase [Candidatus Saccharibacteria bacterium]|nr:choloylglycine hydrolase [Candidatus Saccharibacteria bacterium]
MCTAIRFCDGQGAMYFGRNLDWSVSYGQKVIITPRKYTYRSAFLGENIMRAGAIIGMAIVEEDTPLYFDCANENGLAIAGLNFPGYTKYESKEAEGKTNVAAYEFPLWVVANFSTVDEVEDALRNVVIVSKPINDKYPVSELHWLIGDKNRSIVVEYSEKGMEVFRNDTDVLTNQPGYNWHKENLRNYMNLSSQVPKEVKWGEATMNPFGAGSLMRGLPGDYYSPSRFVRAAFLNTHYPTQSTEDGNVSRLFHTLTGVAMIDGASAMADGTFEKTIYTSGYSASSKTYYYNTYGDPSIRKIALGDYDLDTSELIQL